MANELEKLAESILVTICLLITFLVSLVIFISYILFFMFMLLFFTPPGWLIIIIYLITRG